MRMITLFAAAIIICSGASASAKPVEQRCGARIQFVYDDSVWKVEKAVHGGEGGMLCEAGLVALSDSGYSIYFWSITLRGQELAMTKKMTPVQLLKRMTDMQSKSNRGPDIEQARQAGGFSYTFIKSMNPAGIEFFMHIGVVVKGDLLLYVMHSYESHRSDKKGTYDEEASRNDFLKILKGVKVQ